jgi:hypothetical protein
MDSSRLKMKVVYKAHQYDYETTIKNSKEEVTADGDPIMMCAYRCRYMRHGMCTYRCRYMRHGTCAYRCRYTRYS